MTTKPTPVHRDMANQFLGKRGDKSVNFRNDSFKRDNVASIEFRDERDMVTAEIVIDPKDNVAMALSILGVGRVTDEVEKFAESAKELGGGRTVEDLIEFAVINLRAALLLKQREQEDTEKLTEDAYALYKTVYPKNGVDLTTFRLQDNNRGYWEATLKRLRKDPTILGSL